MKGFVGNVEGRDFMHDTVDVIVTDGFTGNVALKTVEGAIRGIAGLVFDALDVDARAAGGVGGGDARAARSGRHARPRHRGRRACCSASTACA